MAKFTEPEDDFSFKPLTEGLGFHKKVIDLKEESFSGQKPSQVAPPVKAKSTPAASQWAPSLRGKVFNDNKKASTQAHVFGQSKTQVAADIHLVACSSSWPAAIFDSTMVLGLILIFSAVIFAITKIDLSQLTDMLHTEETAQWATLALLVSVYEIYTVSCRTFFGKTLGESVFDYRLGTKEAQLSVIYPIKVAWRSLLIAATGFITLPLLSTLLRKDIPGLLSGVSLYTEKK